MEQYLEVARRMLKEGYYRPNPHNPANTDEASIGLFESQMRFDPADGFPLLTVRDMSRSIKGIIAEMLWFLSGSTSVYDLHKMGVHFWDQWATAETSGTYGHPPGELGPLYGHQWRNFGATRLPDGSYLDDGIDQIAALVEELRTRPNSKRLKVTTWNPQDVEHLWLAPCHGDIKCVVHDGVLDLSMSQRSADLPIGVPFNIASYALLHRMLAQVTGLEVGEFVHNLQDGHIYMNQVPYMETLIEREPRPMPQIRINPEVTDIFGFKLDDFEIVGYDPHPAMNDIPVAL